MMGFGTGTNGVRLQRKIFAKDQLSWILRGGKLWQWDCFFLYIPSVHSCTIACEHVCSSWLTLTIRRFPMSIQFLLKEGRLARAGLHSWTAQSMKVDICSPPGVGTGSCPCCSPFLGPPPHECDLHPSHSHLH